MNWDSIWEFIKIFMHTKVEVWMLLLVILLVNLLASNNAEEIKELKKIAHEE